MISYISYWDRNSFYNVRTAKLKMSGFDKMFHSIYKVLINVYLISGFNKVNYQRLETEEVETAVVM